MPRPSGYLTIKQRRFAKALATASSQTEAARIAGYSSRRANRSAYENVSNRDVMAAAATYAKGKGLDLSREVLERELAAAALAEPVDPVLWQHKLNALQQIAKLRRYIDNLQPPMTPSVTVTLSVGDKVLVVEPQGGAKALEVPHNG